MTSLRQIEANQRNAQHSTGPRTDEGKEQSRRNALKHGLAGEGVVLPEDESEEIAHRKAEWHSSLRPWNALEDWIAGQVAIASVQIDRCQANEQILRTQVAERASTRWDADRRLAAEILAGGLARKPALVSRQLQMSPQGCDWIIERWEGLAAILEQNGDWTESQRALALDLIGTPPELRAGPTRLDPAPGVDAKACRAAVIADELQWLRHSKQTVLADLDRQERLAAQMGVEYDVPRPLALLRRYEAACQRRLHWALGQLRNGQRSLPDSLPTPSPTPAPAPRPGPQPPPFDARLVASPEDQAPLFDPLGRDALREHDRPRHAPAPAPTPKPPGHPSPLSPPLPTPTDEARRQKEDRITAALAHLSLLPPIRVGRADGRS